MRKPATYMLRNTGDPRTARRFRGLWSTTLGARNDRAATTSNEARHTSAKQRYVHRQPLSAMRASASGGPMSVPTPMPETATPTATARYRSNQPDTWDTNGT